MSIWFKPYTLENIRAFTDIFMVKHLGIELEKIGDDYLVGVMPVDDRTKMPLGLLHGGASCVLAETLASMASFLCINPEYSYTVGLEINANHVRGVKSGKVTGICKPLHIGRSHHVWNIEISDDTDRLVCVSRVTMAVLAGKPSGSPLEKIS